MTETEKTPLERARALLAERIERLRKMMAKYNREMTTDFLRFYRRYADATYKAICELAALEHICEELDASTDHRDVILTHAARYRTQLLYQTVAPRTTTELGMRSHVLEWAVRVSIYSLLADMLLAWDEGYQGNP